MANLTNSSLVEEDSVIGEWNFLYTIMSVLSVTGVAGNGLVIYVFWKKQDKLISTFFIISLGIVDFITCLVIIPFTIYMEYFAYSITVDFFCKCYYFLITSNIPLSSLIMVAIAIDRYLCICHPFLNALNMTRAKIITAIMCLFSAALGVIVSVQHGIIYKEKAVQEINPSANQTSINATLSGSVLTQYKCESYASSANFIWYYQKFYLSLFAASLLVVIVLYSMIYYSVHLRRLARARQRSSALPLVKQSNGGTDNKANESLITKANENGHNQTVKMESGMRTRDAHGGSRRKSMKNADRIANIKTALMLFVVTVVFMVTYIPAALMALELISYVPLIFYMYFANNVANPIVYGFMNKNFRDDLYKIFCWRRS